MKKNIVIMGTEVKARNSGYRVIADNGNTVHISRKDYYALGLNKQAHANRVSAIIAGMQSAANAHIMGVQYL